MSIQKVSGLGVADGRYRAGCARSAGFETVVAGSGAGAGGKVLKWIENTLARWWKRDRIAESVKGEIRGRVEGIYSVDRI